MNIDTSTPTGALQFNLLASIYQFEREIMLERQKVGIEKQNKKVVLQEEFLLLEGSHKILFALPKKV